MTNHAQTEQELNSLLADGLVRAPDDFSDKLLQRLTSQAESSLIGESSNPPMYPGVTTPLWQWFALGTASLAGTVQLTGFVFGVWATSVAG